MQKFYFLLFSMFFIFSIAFSQENILENGTSCFPQGNVSAGSSRNGNNTLGSIYNTSKCGLNFTQASRKVTNRNNVAGGTGAGSGLPVTLTIAGIPASCYTIENAYLWYSASWATGQPTSPAISVTNPASAAFAYTAVQVGQDAAKCWGETNIRTFRTDVTSSISGNGNYIINTTSPFASVDGMMLFIIFSDQNATYQGSMVLYDGCNSAAGVAAEVTVNLSFTPACAASTYARAFSLVPDMQNPTDDNHESRLNGVNATYTDNFFNFDMLATTVSAGQSTSLFGVTPGDDNGIGLVATDCFAWIMSGLYYRTTACTTSGPCVPLPLEWLSFEVIKNEKTVALEWATSAEINNDYFLIERSKDGIYFEPLDSIDGTGNSSQVSNYSIVDTNPFNGTSYYRIKQIDFNGQSTYSEMKSVEFNSLQELSFNVIPNPSNGGGVYLNLTGIVGESVTVNILDVKGEKVYTENLQLLAAVNNIIDINKQLPVGVYFIQVINAQSVKTQKMFVK